MQELKEFFFEKSAFFMRCRLSGLSCAW